MLAVVLVVLLLAQLATPRRPDLLAMFIPGPALGPVLVQDQAAAGIVDPLRALALRLLAAQMSAAARVGVQCLEMAARAVTAQARPQARQRRQRPMAPVAVVGR
jgi:hypothetical protein